MVLVEKITVQQPPAPAAARRVALAIWSQRSPNRWPPRAGSRSRPWSRWRPRTPRLTCRFFLGGNGYFFEGEWLIMVKLSFFLMMVDYEWILNESTIGRLWLIMVVILMIVDSSIKKLMNPLLACGRGRKCYGYGTSNSRFFFGEEHVFWDGLSYWCLVGNGWVAGGWWDYY